MELVDVVQLTSPAALLTFVVWWIIHGHLTRKHEQRTKRVELLMDAYRKVCDVANRWPEQTTAQEKREVDRGLEQALADIQLLGRGNQHQGEIGLAIEILERMASSGSSDPLMGKPIGDLLQMLRDNVRQELGLNSVEGQTILHLRMACPSPEYPCKPR